MNRISSPWLTLPQGAEYVQMDVQPFRQLVYSGAIPSHKRSERRVFVHKDDLDALMRSYPSASMAPKELSAT